MNMSSNDDSNRLIDQRIRWGRTDRQTRDHAWISDESYYLPLCFSHEAVPHGKLILTAMNRPCAACARHYELISEARAARQRTIEAERRRRRYSEDPEFRSRVKGINSRYAEKRKAATPTVEATFDSLLAGYRAKWAVESLT